MKHTVYRMMKMAFDHRLGGYTSIERDVGNLSLADVRRRVARLPETTVWLWSIEKQRITRDGLTRIGQVNAEEFLGDVPTF